ncbi:MAG: thioredoxin-disulfide reductase [Cyclobacteriaceae bacterium]|nr:thioredoxin-disulfide reductase [Cyclobacteriaceae bacterium]
MESSIEVLIIGSGPAGYTAAIYAARAGLKPVMYQGMQPGGQLTITNDVENFPGYPDGVNGPQMMMDLQAQAERFETDVRYGMITSVDLKKYPFEAIVDEETKITANTIIIATGASARWLGIPSEKKLNGKGVSACAVCDGFFFKGQEVAIVGGGDTACEEATYLAKLCKKVHMIVRRDVLRASKIMAARVMNTPNIEIHWHSITDEIIGENEVEAVRLKHVETGEKTTIPVKGFFVAIGHEPNTGIFKGYLDMDDAGYIITKPGSTRTNIAGVFASGDAQDKVYRQAVTAAGTGCMAALDAERWLAEQEGA